MECLPAPRVHPIHASSKQRPILDVLDPGHRAFIPNFSFAQIEENVTRTDVRYVYIGQHIAGYGFAWTAYSVEYGPEHDIAKDIIDKSLKRLGIVRPEVKFEATHAA